MIGTIRDGNVVIASNLKRKNTSTPLDYDLAVYYWRRSMEVIEEIKDRWPDRLRIVSFEQLVSTTEDTVRPLCDFVGVDFEPRMLEGYKYTWSFPGRTKIDPSRTDVDADFRLEEKYPDDCDRYTRLLAASVGS